MCKNNISQSTNKKINPIQLSKNLFVAPFVYGKTDNVRGNSTEEARTTPGNTLPRRFQSFCEYLTADYLITTSGSLRLYIASNLPTSFNCTFPKISAEASKLRTDTLQRRNLAYKRSQNLVRSINFTEPLAHRTIGRQDTDLANNSTFYRQTGQQFHILPSDRPTFPHFTADRPLVAHFTVRQANLAGY